MNDVVVLVAIDLQKAFCTTVNKGTVPKITGFIAKWQAANRPIVYTRFVNTPNSPYTNLLHWERCKEQSQEIEFIDEISPQTKGKHVVTKSLYSAFTEEFVSLLSEYRCSKILLCGFSTHACVLKTALDAFERGIQPVVLTDLCGSHNGAHLHESGLILLQALIGKHNLLTSESINFSHL